jgi:hypothetical protein
MLRITQTTKKADIMDITGEPHARYHTNIQSLKTFYKV